MEYGICLLLPNHRFVLDEFVLIFKLSSMDKFLLEIICFEGFPYQ